MRYKAFFRWSGREDLNLRPLGPEPSALTKLRYAPKNTIELYHNQLVEATNLFGLIYIAHYKNIEKEKY